jgi:hypothetical protein
MEAVMRDNPQLEACPLEPHLDAEPSPQADDHPEETLYDQVARILPRLSTISTSVALLGPIFIQGGSSYGRGGC